MERVKEITWLKNAVSIHKPRIEEIYDQVEICDPHKVNQITKQLIDKARIAIKQAKQAVLMSPLEEDSKTLIRLSMIIDGLASTLFTPDGRKMSYEYASMAKSKAFEALDIANCAYDRLISSIIETPVQEILVEN